VGISCNRLTREKVSKLCNKIRFQNVISWF
jgi:hypothetical protein